MPKGLSTINTKSIELATKKVTQKNYICTKNICLKTESYIVLLQYSTSMPIESSSFHIENYRSSLSVRVYRLNPNPPFIHKLTIWKKRNFIYNNLQWFTTISRLLTNTCNSSPLLRRVNGETHYQILDYHYMKFSYNGRNVKMRLYLPASCGLLTGSRLISELGVRSAGVERDEPGHSGDGILCTHWQQSLL